MGRRQEAGLIQGPVAGRGEVWMAELIVNGRRLEVRLSALEKLGALRGGLSVPLGAVRAVTVENEPYKALRGVRAPGIGLPGVIALGSWRWSAAGKDFVALRGSGPAVRVVLAEEARFGAIVVTVPDAEGTERELLEVTGLDGQGAAATYQPGTGDGGGLSLTYSPPPGQAGPWPAIQMGQAGAPGAVAEGAAPATAESGPVPGPASVAEPAVEAEEGAQEDDLSGPQGG